MTEKERGYFDYFDLVDRFVARVRKCFGYTQVKILKYRYYTKAGTPQTSLNLEGVKWVLSNLEIRQMFHFWSDKEIEGIVYYKITGNKELM